MRKVAACTSERQRVVVRTPQDAHVDARGADRVEQRVEVAEPGRRDVLVACVAHAAHRGAGLGQGLAGHVCDALEGRPYLVGIRVDQRPPGPRLHGDGAEVVADDVVDFACDAHALAGGCLAGLGGAQLRQAAALLAHLGE